MTSQTELQIRQLLKPTDEKAGWYKSVKSLNQEEALPILLRIARNDGEAVLSRITAIKLIEIFKDKRAIDTLVKLVSESSDPVLRAQAIRALEHIGEPDPGVIEILIAALTDQDYFVRESSARALGKLKRAEAIPALKDMVIGDSVTTNREIAQKAIREIQNGA
jgi:HEAT repeat protein